MIVKRLLEEGDITVKMKVPLSPEIEFDYDSLPRLSVIDLKRAEITLKGESLQFDIRVRDIEDGDKTVGEPRIYFSYRDSVICITNINPFENGFTSSDALKAAYSILSQRGELE